MSRIHLRFASLFLLLATVLISLTPHISGVVAGCPDVLGYSKAWKSQPR